MELLQEFQWNSGIIRQNLKGSIFLDSRGIQAENSSGISAGRQCRILAECQ